MPPSACHLLRPPVAEMDKQGKPIAHDSPVYAKQQKEQEKDAKQLNKELKRQKR